ncbi:MAG: molecular chaperone [Verrucomicrobia bacterium]|nr:molecular chaperone [Deltaproteobacteria bacterium]
MLHLKCLIMLAMALLFAALATSAGWAATFSVAPVRVMLDGQRRTERLTVKNESDRPLTLLIKPYLWTQSTDGSDRYEEKSDLIIFPKALTVLPGEERAIRVGIGALPGLVEKAFRIYLEEQPLKDDQTQQGAVARILMRVGIPVFAQPRQPEPVPRFAEMAVAKGTLRLTLTNSGNSFAMAEQVLVRGLDDKGTELFAKALGGFYLLAGTTRTLEVPVSKEQCRLATRITATTRSNGKELFMALDKRSSVCEGQ